MAFTFIYALKEPDTGEIRYVGKANDPKERFRLHLTRARLNIGKTHKDNWIRSLTVTPILEILDEVLVEHWQQWEIAYIEFFRELGCDLVNATPGGDAGPVLCGENNFWFGKKHSSETRQKMSLAARGNKRRVGQSPSEDTRQKLSRSHIGKKHSPETILKMAESAKRRWETYHGV